MYCTYYFCRMYKRLFNLFFIIFQIANNSMPAVATDVDAVSTKSEVEKSQNETVAKCPFAHTKHAGDTDDECGIKTNGNQQNGNIKNLIILLLLLLTLYAVL